ncbi:hypothetical protein LPJ71_003443, partial [Coemansia sp. S17]
MDTISFSTFSVVSGGKLDLAEPPARVVAAIPFEHCCVFVIPAKTTHCVFSTALSNAGVSDIKLFYALVNEADGVALVGVQSAEELAMLKKATFLVRGVQVTASRAIAFNDRLLSVHISRLEATSYENSTRNIYQALHPFGDVLDITFSQTGKVTDACALVVLTTRSDEDFPSQLRIGKNKAAISSSMIIEEDCK